MSRRLRAWTFSLLVPTVMAAACGGSKSTPTAPTAATPPTATTPPAPTAPPAPTTTCRTYPTSATVRTINTASTVTVDAIETGAFDSSTRKSTVTTNFTNGAPCSVAVTSYSSVADFVDEVRVIPGVFLATGNTNANSGACGTGTASVAYSYDSQRRLMQETNSAGGVTTYTAWDSSGRPTSGASGTGISIANVYNDTARTLTQTQVQPNGTRTVATTTFDPNGNQVSIVVTQANATSTTTFSNTSTATVCK